jgi:hypothetical protein
MLKFSKFITESTQYITEEAGASANSAGVLFETKLMHKLHGGHPELHPNADGQTPREAHDHHAAQIDSALHDHIENASVLAAPAVRKHMTELGLTKENEPLHVVWTSKPGQVSTVTGKNDPNNPGDFVTWGRRSKQTLAWSVKYGDKPGLRSPGLKDMDRILNTDHDAEALAAHKADLVKHMGKYVKGTSQPERNKEYRAAAKTPAGKKLADAVAAQSLEYRKGMAKRYADAFNSLPAHKHHDVVRRFLNAEPTQTAFRKVHVDKNLRVHITDPVAEFKAIHTGTKHYSAEHSGAYLNLLAHKKNGDVHQIARINIKDKSSPMTNVVGNVSAGKDYNRAAGLK